LVLVTAVGLAAGRAAGVANGAPGSGQLVSMSTRTDGGITIRYRATGIDGASVVQSAVVWLPTGPASGDVVAWAHETVGLADRCAPSRSTPSVPALDEWLAAGAVVVAPDYEGLGSAGVHPYLVGASEARSVLDSLRAARRVSGAEGRSAVFGWSQGGHAAVWAARLAPTYAPDVRLAGVAALAPVTDVSDMIDGSSPLSHLPGVVSMIAAGYVAAYPGLDPDGLLDQPSRQLEMARTECDPAGRLEGTSTHDAGSTWRKRLRENDVSNARTRVPVLIVHGEDDFILPAAGAERAYERLCERDSTVHFLRYQGIGHQSVPAASSGDVVQWLLDRMAGVRLIGCAEWLVPAPY